MPTAFRTPGPPTLGPGSENEERATLDAARLITFAVTALLISFLVIGRTSSVLDADAQASGSTLSSGRVELRDDDNGATLFDLPALLPGEPVTNCLEVVYLGSVFGGDIRLSAKGGGELAPYLDTEILIGEGGGFENCDDFVPTDTLFEGTLEELGAAHGVNGTPLSAFPIREARVARTFQITFELRDDAAAEGGSATTSFQWTVDA